MDADGADLAGNAVVRVRDCLNRARLAFGSGRAARHENARRTHASHPPGCHEGVVWNRPW